jgi:CheY-like chemotaxis protein
LVVNARDAMADGGTLTIRTRNAGADGLPSRSRLGAPLWPHIVISVEDTGVGIDAETQKRIFEPFFTTKEKPHGTGLGLATVYGIVSQSGGQVVVDSEPGHGARFDIYLPLAEDEPEMRPPAEAPAAVGRGSETILLVEDEDAVRDLTRRCLEARGYRVIEASSAEDAEKELATHPTRLDLLLTDVVMPGASGPELARRLQGERPDLNVLFVSGYTDDSMAAHRVLDPGASFLQKPFTPDTLARKVREVLDARQPVA